MIGLRYVIFSFYFPVLLSLLLFYQRAVYSQCVCVCGVGGGTGGGGGGGKLNTYLSHRMQTNVMKRFYKYDNSWTADYFFLKTVDAVFQLLPKGVIYFSIYG